MALLIVEPPAGNKSIIDMTASFVGRNGPEFETRIKNEQNNSRFSFLKPNDPFNPYYRAKIIELAGTFAPIASSGDGRGSADAPRAAAADANDSGYAERYAEELIESLRTTAMIESLRATACALQCTLTATSAAEAEAVLVSAEAEFRHIGPNAQIGPRRVSVTSQIIQQPKLFSSRPVGTVQQSSRPRLVGSFDESVSFGKSGASGDSGSEGSTTPDDCDVESPRAPCAKLTRVPDDSDDEPPTSPWSKDRPASQRVLPRNGSRSSLPLPHPSPPTDAAEEASVDEAAAEERRYLALPPAKEADQRISRAAKLEAEMHCLEAALASSASMSLASQHAPSSTSGRREGTSGNTSGGAPTLMRRDSVILRDLLEHAENTRGVQHLFSTEHPRTRERPARRPLGSEEISPPTVPRPSLQFLGKARSKARQPTIRRLSQKSVAPSAASQTNVAKACDEMHSLLYALQSQGVRMPAVPWREESCSEHLRLFRRHMGRALYLSLVPASWRPRSSSNTCSSSSSRSSCNTCSSSSSSSSSSGGGTTNPGGAVERGGGGGGGRSSSAGDSNASLESYLHSRCLAMPSEPRKESWDMLMLVLILYSMWMVPLRICFDEEATGCWLAFEILISIAFMLDVVITFNTVVYEATTGTWVLSRRQIAQRYLGGWFWIDAPASVPVELIDITIDRLSNSGDTGSLGALRMLRLFRLFRLLRLLKLGDYIEVLESAADMNLKFLKILLMKFQLIAIAHLLGCFWFSMYVLNSADPALTTWAETYDEGRAVKEGTSTSLKYMYSIYWAAITLTTIGYGDVVPVNDSERMYTIGAMLCAALVFGYMASGIGQVVGSMDRTRALADEKTSQIKEYLAWRNLPVSLAIRFRKFYRGQHALQNAVFDERNEVQILEGLPPMLRKEVEDFVQRQTLGRLPFFAGMQVKNSTFQMEVFALIRNVSYVKGEVVFKRGEPSRAIMFLSSGEVVVYSPASVSPLARITPDTEITLMHGNADMEVMRFKHEGCLGETLLTGRRRPVTIVAKAHTEMLLLTNEGLLSLFEKNPYSACMLVRPILRELDRKTRHELLRLRIRMCTTSIYSFEYNVLVIQKRWKRFACNHPRETSILGRYSRESIMAGAPKGAPARGAVGPMEVEKAVALAAIEAAEARVAALLRELNVQLAHGPATPLAHISADPSQVTCSTGSHARDGLRHTRPLRNPPWPELSCQSSEGPSYQSSEGPSHQKQHSPRRLARAKDVGKDLNKVIQSKGKDLDVKQLIRQKVGTGLGSLGNSLELEELRGDYMERDKDALWAKAGLTTLVSKAMDDHKQFAKNRVVGLVHGAQYLP